LGVDRRILNGTGILAIAILMGIGVRSLWEALQIQKAVSYISHLMRVLTWESNVLEVISLLVMS